MPDYAELLQPGFEINASYPPQLPASLVGAPRNAVQPSGKIGIVSGITQRSRDARQIPSGNPRRLTLVLPCSLC